MNEFTMIADPPAPTPVVVSVSHDMLDNGEMDALLGAVPARQVGVTDGDQNVWLVAAELARLAPVHMVRGLMPRLIVDYNRAREEAFEDPDLAGAWEAYHAAIGAAVTAAQAAGRRPLLLDLHGFSETAPYGDFDILLGTHYRTTVTSDVDARLGEQLRAAGYRVFVPGPQPQVPGVPDLNDGGYTVQSVAAKFGVDAVQLEMQAQFRDPMKPKDGLQLASHLAKFVMGL